MQGEHGKAPLSPIRRSAVLAQSLRGRHGLLQVVPQGVDHDIAHEVDARLRDALAQQVLPRAFLGDEQQIRDLVGEHAVDLLRHGAVEAAQSRFDVYHRDAFLDRHQRARQRGVHVPHHQHRGGPLPVEDRLEAPHDLGGLHRMRGRTHLQVDIRIRYSQRLEVLAVHLRVVMLPGMHEPHRQRRGGALHGPDDRGDLHEVRARPDHAEYGGTGDRDGISLPLLD